MKTVDGTVVPRLADFVTSDPVRVRVDSLKEDPNNVNEHSDFDLDVTGESISQFGQVENLVVRKSTNVVIGGNGRLRKLKENKVEFCWVVFVDGSDDAVTALGIVLNKSTRNSDFNYTKLVGTLQHFEQMAPELLHLTGFPDYELGPLLASELSMPPAAAEEIPEEPKEKKKRGEELDKRGVTLLFDTTQRLDLDKAITLHRASIGNYATSMQESITEICKFYIASQSEE